jgi:hypothetical protein
VILLLSSLLADHEFMIKKLVVDVPPVQAFTATSGSSIPDDTMQTLQQLITKLGLQLQPDSSAVPASSNNSGKSTAPSTAFYTSRGRGRGANHYNRGRGGRAPATRGTNYNRGGSSQFQWVSNQNITYGSCNRCGIGHLPTHCPNRDPATIRSRQLTALITGLKVDLHGFQTQALILMLLYL